MNSLGTAAPRKILSALFVGACALSVARPRAEWLHHVLCHQPDSVAQNNFSSTSRVRSRAGGGGAAPSSHADDDRLAADACRLVS